MNFQYEHERIFSTDESGKLLAEITFPIRGGVADIAHTFVDPCLRGQGVAGQLMAAAVAELRTRNVTITATCPYSVKWLAEHPKPSDFN